MRMHLTVTYENDEDNPIEVVAWDTDMVALEKHFDIDTSMLADRQRMEWFSYLAWTALTRQKKTSKTFEDWLAGGVDVTPHDAEGAGSPEGSEEQPGSSPPSSSPLVSAPANG